MSVDSEAPAVSVAVLREKIQNLTKSFEEHKQQTKESQTETKGAIEKLDEKLDAFIKAAQSVGIKVTVALGIGGAVVVIILALPNVSAAFKVISG